MSNRIDECSQDDQDGTPDNSSRNRNPLSLSNKSNRDHISEEFGGISENEKSCRSNLKEDKIGTGSFFDEIESMKAKEEPKSGLIR